MCKSILPIFIFVIMLLYDHYIYEIKLNWTELNWTELNWTELNWTELNWTELNWTELNWTELNWTELNWTELNWTELNWTELNWTELNWTELNWTELNSCSLRIANFKQTFWLCSPATNDIMRLFSPTNNKLHITHVAYQYQPKSFNRTPPFAFTNFTKKTRHFDISNEPI